nr:RNA-directed DNA polymerase, eukaryota [Tanacetum cinerariifolium]
MWDYLQSEICKWNGEVVIMGDFNEVRYKSDRYGSKFNAHSAMVFNSFILNSGLVEVSLGGCSFTWCHKIAAKMSKLDRFLVSESFLNSCPNINAITLERYLSDHRPILLHDAHVDYGTTPFRFFIIGLRWRVLLKWWKMGGEIVRVTVSEVQSAFIAGRRILDGPFILNEVLQWCKIKKKQALIFKGLQLGGSVNLSHMFFADDAIFVGQWSEGNINSLVNILECFNMASGLKINMRKSKIMGVHVTRDKVDKATTKLGCLVLKAPFLYLESMVGGAMSRSKSWSDGKVEASMKVGTRSCWMNILHEVNVLSKKGIDLKKFMRFKVGNGENIMFRDDTWNEGGKFKCRFPRMYALESCKSITVGRKFAQSSLIDSFRRSPRGGAEQQQYNDPEDMVTTTILAPMSDRLVWSLESSREFTLASVRKLIDDKWLPGADNKTRWIKYVPIKINVHAWKVMSDSIPTRFNISMWESALIR